MHILMVLLLLLIGGVAPAAADPYFNSSEPGCGTDPNVLMCDDFEKKANGTTPGDWYTTDCDHGGWVAGNKGWCGTIYGNPITPPGAVTCGTGVTPFGSCAANGGAHGGTGGRNMALHHFKTSTCGSTGQERCGVNEVYVRWYAKWLAPYSFGAEKHMNITNSDGDIAFANVQLNCGAGGASSTAGVAVQVLHGMDRCQWPNVSGIDLVAGRWYFFEMHVKAGSAGLIELWVNDCGADGKTCGSAPILRTKFSGNLPGNANGSQIETIWLENWANPGSSGTGPLWDNVKVSRVGPIGFAGTSGTVPPPTVTYTLTATPQGAGTVSGAGSYPSGTVVTPVALAASGSTFSGWSGDCTGTGACTVTMTSNRNVTATFTGTPPTTSLPPAPTNTAAVLGSQDATGVNFNVSWTAASTATSYSYTAGINDGSANQQGAVTPPSLLLKMPYLQSGAAGSGFVCIKSVNAAGSSADAACNGLDIPARAVTPPPQATGTLTAETVVSRCNYFLTAIPPDGTSGWVAQFYRDGTIKVGAAITAAPYKRSLELYAPSHSFTVQFTKAGTTMRSPAAVTRVCP